MDGCSGNSTSTTPFHLPIEDEQVKPRRNYDYDMNIEASTKQGLLCCVRWARYHYRYHVCKPSTKQWLKLPNPKTRYRTVKVALIVLRSKPLHFKIIRLSSPLTLYHHYRKLGLDYYRCEVFDSECWEWRRGKDLLFPPKLYFDVYKPAVNAGGLIYCKLGYDEDGQVMALNYDGEEAFPRFSLPMPPFDAYVGYYPYNQLLEYKEKLGFTYMLPNGMMKLWVFDNGKRVWLLNKQVYIGGIVKYPKAIGFYNADIALISDWDRLIFYKLQDKSFKSVELKKCPTAREVFPFRSDLEPMDMPRERIVSSAKHLSWINLLIVFIFLFAGLLFFHA
ncbi:unnamed protein product [Withania somnifera]